MHSNFWATCGCFFAFMAVALGAFAAHALKAKFPPESLSIFETGVRYQMYHAIALFLVSFMQSQNHSPLLSYAGYAFILGILLFSGSLYLLVTTATKGWGMITPIGGVCFLVGWAILGVVTRQSLL